MAITSQYTDTVEPVADTDAEAATNQHLFGVISGCAVTFDATDMTYDVAAGTILHNGSPVSVSAQANAGTLVADGTNPRWATIYLDSSGVEGVVHGTAAADPSKPETGDNVAIAMVLIANGATIASSQTTFDKRVWTHPQGASYKYLTAGQNFTSATYADVNATSGTLSFTASANMAYYATWELDLTTAAAGGLKLQLTGPAAPTALQIFADLPVSDGVGGSASVHWLGTYFQNSFSANIFALAGGATGTGNQIQGLCRVTALLVNGATSGAVTLQAAQNTASGTTTIQYARLIVTPASVAT